MTDIPEDVLLHRALDRSADATDWRALRARANDDPAVWRRLADGLEDDGRLTRAVSAVVAPADGVELPIPAAHDLPRGGAPPWLGWAAAALLLVAWSADRLGEPSATPTGPDDRTTAIPITPVTTAPLTTVSTNGEVVTEFPVRMLDSRPAKDGDGFDVLVLRRTVERRRIDALYRMAIDEHGLPAPVPVRWTPQDQTEQM